jgi:UDP-2,3-diacylglucosamine pyrophosphatase LpxH
MRDHRDANRIRLRSAFISDVHLGSRDCRAAELLEFLERLEVETLFLVGDIVDVWSLRRRFYWPAEHNAVVRAILAKARAGVKVIYIPGNHDEDARSVCGSMFGNLHVRRRYVHSTADGRRLLVLHGDELDGAVQCSPWLARLGGGAYALALWLNRCLNSGRRLLRLPHWSLANYLKMRIGNAVRHIEAFERAAADLARQQGLDGVVCGHIHRASLRDIDGTLYCNDGDWVESCTALVEDHAGQLSIWSIGELAQAAANRELLEAAA